MTYVDEVLADNPTALFILDETSGDPVSSNGLYTATREGSPVAEAGPKGGQSLYFDGVDDRLAIQGFPDVGAGGNFSFEVWVKYSSFTNDFVNQYPTFARRDGNGTAWLLRTRGGDTNPNLIESWQNGQTTEATGAFHGGWHHVVFVSNNYVGTIYVDGIAYSQHYGGSASGSPGTSNPMYLAYGVSSSEWFRGNLAFPAFYPNALTATRIRAHYNAIESGPPISLLAGEAGLLALGDLNGPTTLVETHVEPPMAVLSGFAGSLGLGGLQGPTLALGEQVFPYVEVLSGYRGGLHLESTSGPTLAKGIPVFDPQVIRSGYAGSMALTGMGLNAPLITDPVIIQYGQWFLDALLFKSDVEVTNPSASPEVINSRKRVKTELKAHVRV